MIAFDEQTIEVLFVRDLNFRSLQQLADSLHGRLKFFGIVGANHALAGRQPQRLDDAGKLHARKNFVQLLVEAERRKIPEPEVPRRAGFRAGAICCGNFRRLPESCRGSPGRAPRTRP